MGKPEHPDVLCLPSFRVAGLEKLCCSFQLLRVERIINLHCKVVEGIRDVDGDTGTDLFKTASSPGIKAGVN